MCAQLGQQEEVKRKWGGYCVGTLGEHGAQDHGWYLDGGIKINEEK